MNSLKVCPTKLSKNCLWILVNRSMFSGIPSRAVNISIISPDSLDSQTFFFLFRYFFFFYSEENIDLNILPSPLFLDSWGFLWEVDIVQVRRGCPIAVISIVKCEKGPLYHLTVGICEKGYPISILIYTN